MAEWKLLIKEGDEWTEVADDKGNYSVTIDENQISLSRQIVTKDRPSLGFEKK